MIEEKNQEIVAAECEKLDQLIAKFTRGFDPSIFRNEVISALPHLAGSAFPSNHVHLLLLLFATDAEVQVMQVELEKWTLQRYEDVFKRYREANSLDETYFAAEIETLRRLLEPLRGDSTHPVYWLGSRRADPGQARQQLEAATTVINAFKKDLIAALHFGPQEREFPKPLPVSVERSALVSIKQLRIDACKDTLQWDEYNKSTLVFTHFHSAYKALICRDNSDKARNLGWLPPAVMVAPRASSPHAAVGDLAYWPLRQDEKRIYDLLIRTAIWLALARGLPAVHLFCDIVRVFTFHKPPKDASLAEVAYLRRLTQLRMPVEEEEEEEAIHPETQIPLTFQNPSLTTSNDTYFKDVWKSDKNLEKDLARHVTLTGLKTAKDVRDSRPLPPRRSFQQQAQLIKDALTVQKGFDDMWPKEPVSSSFLHLKTHS
ncbi:uncharacterized protein BP01DRAFT_286057 [Aspergillus saccharolyticus JOP 1030-1]|uniref:Uncharacterized protein n=1 Tax=Aspergillus saccharolyticus JOP 1030-1 TaxID=1450539 RepID=A0A319A0V5_9EURO|nr:hypothetical protein BP01DRAFT_286057 [Aspergillus saccharolyticus JOP 1030-1]PYH50063.1 hypothetical protein BP01DRAFT_286057 [Aspergillus saccharolyticus JOP 1030-1]